MRLEALTAVLSKLGVKPSRPKRKRDQSGKDIFWVDFPCPLAPWLHRSGHDSSPSAGAVADETGVSHWKCHTCKSHGRITSLIRQLEEARGQVYPGLTREAELADMALDVDTDYGDFERPVVTEVLPEPLVEEAYAGLYSLAWNIPAARVYLETRGISAKTTQALGLLFDEGQSRILFPVRDYTGALYGFSGRAIDPAIKPKIRDYFGLPKRHLLLGEERWQSEKPVLIVEGLFGYAHLVEIGAERFFNIGAILGSVMTREKAARLKTFGEAVFLMLDNDEAGDDGLFGHRRLDGSRETEAGAVHQLLGHVPVFVPVWPDGDAGVKIDPDQLTLGDIQAILEETDVFAG